MTLYLKKGQTFSDIFPWIEWVKLFPASKDTVGTKRLNARKYVGVWGRHYNPWKRRSEVGERASKIFIDCEIAISLLEGDEHLGKLLHGLEVYMSYASELKIRHCDQVIPENRSLTEKFIAECIVVQLKPGMEEISAYIQRQYGLKVEDSIETAISTFIGAPLLSTRKEFGSVKELVFVHYQK